MYSGFNYHGAAKSLVDSRKNLVNSRKNWKILTVNRKEGKKELTVKEIVP